MNVRPTLLAIAAALALLTRLLVPAGFMPAANRPALVLCTGQGAVTLANRHTPATPAGHDGECPFTAAAAPGTAADAAPLIAPAAAIYAAAEPAIRAALRFGEGLGRPPLPATGPPARS